MSYYYMHLELNNVVEWYWAGCCSDQSDGTIGVFGLTFLPNYSIRCALRLQLYIHDVHIGWQICHEIWWSKVTKNVLVNYLEQFSIFGRPLEFTLSIASCRARREEHFEKKFSKIRPMVPSVTLRYCAAHLSVFFGRPLCGRSCSAAAERQKLFSV